MEWIGWTGNIQRSDREYCPMEIKRTPCRLISGGYTELSSWQNRWRLGMMNSNMRIPHIATRASTTRSYGQRLAIEQQGFPKHLQQSRWECEECLESAGGRGLRNEDHLSAKETCDGEPRKCVDESKNGWSNSINACLVSYVIIREEMWRRVVRTDLKCFLVHPIIHQANIARKKDECYHPTSCRYSVGIDA